MKLAYALRNLAAIILASGALCTAEAQYSQQENNLNSILAKKDIKEAMKRCGNPEIRLDSLTGRVAVADEFGITLSKTLKNAAEMESVLRDQFSGYIHIYEEYLKKEKQAEKNLLDILAEPHIKKNLQECGNPDVLLYNFSSGRKTFQYLYCIVLDMKLNKKDMESRLTEEILNYCDNWQKYLKGEKPQQWDSHWFSPKTF
jgi:hypothetical protein